MGRRIGIALLSFAHNHQFHWARAFRSDPRVRMVVSWDSNRERGITGARETGTRFTSELDVVLSDSNVQAVAICSETNLHAELTIAAAKAGKHVLCEKPMATSLEECKEMLRAVGEYGVKYMQAFPQRHIPSNGKIKELLQAQAIGKVSLVRKRHGHSFALQGLPQSMPWIVDTHHAGAGAFLDEGIHECDVLRWFFGDPISVTAMVGNSVADIAAFGVDDFGAAIFRFQGGEIAVLEAGWAWVAGGPTTEIYGDQGTIIQSLTDCASNAVPLKGLGYLQIFKASERDVGWQDLGCAFDFSFAHERVATAFVDCLEGDTPPPVTAYDGLKALEMMLGAYLSARTGQVVNFPLNA